MGSVHKGTAGCVGSSGVSDGSLLPQAFLAVGFAVSSCADKCLGGEACYSHPCKFGAVDAYVTHAGLLLAQCVLGRASLGMAHAGVCFCGHGVCRCGTRTYHKQLTICAAGMHAYGGFLVCKHSLKHPHAGMRCLSVHRLASSRACADE